jgi:hypothetical protein
MNKILLTIFILIIGCNLRPKEGNEKGIDKGDSLSLASNSYQMTNNRSLTNDTMCSSCHSANLKLIGPALNRYLTNPNVFIHKYILVSKNKYHINLAVDTLYLKKLFRFFKNRDVICDTLFKYD